MTDPTDMRLCNNLAADSGLKIIPFIATKQEIRDAISHHYLGKPAARPTSRTILAVDDDSLIRSMLTEILEKDGYRVLTAADGMQAFRTVIAESPHVVITDLVMPKLDGYGLLNALKNIPETSFIPVILISGQLKSEEEELKAFEKGFFDVILKPLNQASVRARVKRAFHFYNNHTPSERPAPRRSASPPLYFKAGEWFPTKEGGQWRICARSIFCSSTTC
jgi:CheY-like chemotaxis protein